MRVMTSYLFELALFRDSISLDEGLDFAGREPEVIKILV